MLILKNNQNKLNFLYKKDTLTAFNAFKRANTLCISGVDNLCIAYGQTMHKLKAFRLTPVSSTKLTILSTQKKPKKHLDLKHLSDLSHLSTPYTMMINFIYKYTQLTH